MLKLAESSWGAHPAAASHDQSRVIVEDSYSQGDSTLFLWEQGGDGLPVINGVPSNNAARTGCSPDRHQLD